MKVETEFLQTEENESLAKGAISRGGAWINKEILLNYVLKPLKKEIRVRYDNILPTNLKVSGDKISITYFTENLAKSLEEFFKEDYYNYKKKLSENDNTYPRLFFTSSLKNLEKGKIYPIIVKDNEGKKTINVLVKV